MKMKSRSLALVAVASLVLSACGGGGDAAPEASGPLTLKVGDQRAISIEVLMKASGQLDDAPYKVEFSTFTAGPPLVEAASAGGIHLAQVGNTPAVFGAAAGAHIKVVGALEATGKGDAILVAKDSPVGAVAELRGKKVAVTKGSSANANLLLHLKNAGLGLSDIEPVYVSPGDGYAALTRGEVAAWAVWDPYTAIAEQEVGARIIAAADTAGNGYNFWVASGDGLDDPGITEAIADFLDRYAVATAWSADNLDAWSARYAELTEISPEASRTTWTRSIKHPVPLSADIIASEQEIADAFTEAKEFPGAVDFADFVDDRFQGEGS